jgi:hypothetical protein
MNERFNVTAKDLNEARADYLNVHSSPPLVIPFDGGKYALIPLGISAEDFDCLQKTLVLWRNRIAVDAVANNPPNPPIQHPTALFENTEVC